MNLYVITCGGFGNVLFQYMAGFSLAKKYGANLYFIANDTDVKRKSIREYDVFSSINIVKNLPERVIDINEAGFTYQPMQLDDLSKNYCLRGYFQSYRYSVDYINEIKQLFDKKKQIENIKQFILDNNPESKPTVMLHVRRTDYLSLPLYHPVQDDTYYESSLRIISERSTNFKVFCFSDDIDFLKNWRLLKKYDHVIVENENTVESFLLMSHCDHFIIANSTFSLLAYYFRDPLNNNPEVSMICMPANWFGPHGPKFNLDDLVCPSENRFIL